MTEKCFGKGRTIHLGSSFSRQSTKMILDYVGVLEPFRAYIEAPEDVELVMREKDGRRFLFCLNYPSKQQHISLKKATKLLYTGETISGPFTLSPFGTAVFELI